MALAEPMAALEDKLDAHRQREWVFGTREDGTLKHHFSPTSAINWWDCGACYELSEFQHAPCPTSIHLPFGSGTHEAFCYARRAVRDRGQYEMAMALEQAVRGFIRNLKVDCPDEMPIQDGYINLGMAIDAGEVMLDLGKDYGNWTDAVAFMQRCVDETLPAVLERERLVGWREDGIETTVNFDGHLPFAFHAHPDVVLADETISDLKTSRSATLPEWSTSWQLMMYALPRWQAMEPFQLAVTQVVKNKTRPYARFFDLPVTDVQMELARTNLLYVANEIQRGSFPVRPTFKCDYPHALPTFVSAA